MRIKNVFVSIVAFIVMIAPVYLAAEDTTNTDDQADSENVGEGYSTLDRIIFSRTAVNNPAKQINLTGYAVGIWDVNYSINQNFNVGGAILLPIYSTAIMPHASANVFLHKNLAIGMGLFAGIWSYYADNKDSYFLWFSGGHVAMTYVNGRHLLNISAMCGTGGDYNKERDFIFSKGLAVIPNIGYRFSVNKSWALLLEAHAPCIINAENSSSENIKEYEYGKIWAVAYGFRGQGGHVFGDFGFVLPLRREFIKTTWKYVPLGIPYFVIGVQF
ncbi:MAG: hypothetical protein JW838_12490 [Spirochaetes bacterium]|nr:hypothetical protein [Spirochaetota bacterium]